MSIITTTDLANNNGGSFTSAETLQAQFAIDQAIGIVSALFQYDIDPSVPGSNTVPAELNMISAASCGTIAAGKFKKYPVLGNWKRIITAPFTNLRQVIFAQRGYDYTGLNTCTAGITFIKPYQIETTFSGKRNEAQDNIVNIVTGFSSLQAFQQGIDSGFGMVFSNSNTIAYIDADWGWSTIPAAVKGMVLAVAQDIFNGSMTSGGLKQESIEGHSYTFADGEDLDEKYEDIISRYGAGSYNIL